MALKFTTSYLEDSLTLFRYYKKLAERAMEQVTDDQLFVLLDDEANSIAIIIKPRRCHCPQSSIFRVGTIQSCL